MCGRVEERFGSDWGNQTHGKQLQRCLQSRPVPREESPAGRVCQPCSWRVSHEPPALILRIGIITPLSRRNTPRASCEGTPPSPWDWNIHFSAFKTQSLSSGQPCLQSNGYLSTRGQACSGKCNTAATKLSHLVAAPGRAQASVPDVGHFLLPLPLQGPQGIPGLMSPDKLA